MPVSSIQYPVFSISLFSIQYSVYSGISIQHTRYLVLSTVVQYFFFSYNWTASQHSPGIAFTCARARVLVSHQGICWRLIKILVHLQVCTPPIRCRRTVDGVRQEREEERDRETGRAKERRMPVHACVCMCVHAGSCTSACCSDNI